MKEIEVLTVIHKRKALLAFLLCIAIGSIAAQKVALKSNLLYDATTTLNVGLEVGLSPKWSLDLPVNYNPWEFSDNKKLKHWLVQPELRYWFCERFNGHFLGLHGHASQFNVGGIKLFGLEDSRFEGNLYGGGLSYGYHWILNTRWSIEATIGLGYAYIDYTEYECARCGSEKDKGTRNYFGPTKAGISLIYIIK